MIREFTSFLIVGAIAAVVNIAARYLLNFAMTYDAAIVIAYIMGVTTAYSLNKIYVFTESGKASIKQYGRFALVNVVALGQVWGVSVGLAEFLFPAIDFTWHAYDVAHVIGVASPALTSYFAHKYFSFAIARDPVDGSSAR